LRLVRSSDAKARNAKSWSVMDPGKAGGFERPRC
jgi:hypothetical protein